MKIRNPDCRLFLLLPRLCAEFHGGFDQYVNSLIREKAKAHFDGVPASGVVESVESSIALSAGGMEIRADISFDYGVLKASTTRKANITPPPHTENESPEDRYAVIFQLVEREVEQFVKNIFENLPTSYISKAKSIQAFRFAFSTLKFKDMNSSIEDVTFGELRQDVAAQSKDMLCQRLMALVGPAFERKRMALTERPGHFPGHITGCDFVLRDRGPEWDMEARVTVEYEKPLVWTATATRPVLQLFRYSRVQDARADIQNVLTELIDETGSLLAKAILPCHVVPGNKDSMFPAAVAGYLCSGSARFGCVTLSPPKNPNRKDWRASCEFLFYHGGLDYELRANMLANTPLVREVVLDVPNASRALSTPLVLGRCKTLQKNVDIFRYCAAVSSLCEKMAAAKHVRCPHLEVAEKNWKLAYIRYRDHTYSSDMVLGEDSEPLKASILPILESILEEEARISAISKAQIEVLSSLNPTELAILRHAYYQGATWFHDAADAVEFHVITTKTYAGDCLLNLCNVEIQTEDGTAPLLRWEWKSSRKHDDYRLFTPVAKLFPEALLAAKPREYRLDEIGAFTAQNRGKWFTQYAVSADTKEKRWEVLRAMESKMPKTYLKEFASTEEGQAFFRAFEGADAMYVQFLLRTTPGCKKLAATIFGSAQETDE